MSLPPTRGSSRLFLAGIVLAALAVLAGGTFIGLAVRDSPRGLIGRLIGGAIGGPFRLVDQNGKTVTDKDLRGKWALIYFGFSHCEDICPAVLNNMAAAFDALGPQRRDRLRLVFVTVDPHRDTPAVLKAYVARFNAPITALTGTPRRIAEAAHAYHVFYDDAPISDKDYDVNHSAIIFLMDPDGRLAATLTEKDSGAEIARRLDKLIS